MYFCRLPPESEPAALAHVHRLGNAARSDAHDRVADDAEHAAGKEGLAVGLVARQHQIVGKRQRRHGGMAMALLRHETRAHQAARRDAEIAGRLAPDGDRARLSERELAGERIEELALPVAGNAGDRQHLAGPHLQTDVPERDCKGRACGCVEVVRFQQHVALHRRARGADGGDVAADHHAGERSRRLPARIAGARHLAVAQHRRAVADALHLFQPVADIEHGAPFRLQFGEGLEQAVGLLRRQHRGRLVEDDEFGVLEKRPHDLDALALADGKVRDMGLRIERQAVGARQRRRLVRHFGKRNAGRQGQCDVLCDRQRLEQRKMLEDHADAKPAGGAGARNSHRLALPDDLAARRRKNAEQHLHQGGLAGAVLAEQGMGFTGLDGEVDAVAGGK